MVSLFLFLFTRFKSLFNPRKPLFNEKYFHKIYDQTIFAAQC